MNLTLVTSYLYPDSFGGINTYVHELANEFARSGHKVAVIGPGAPGCASSQDLPLYRIHRFPSTEGRWAVRNFLTLRNFRKAAKQVAQDFAIDRWFSNDLFSGLAVQRWIGDHPAHWTAVCHSLQSAETSIQNSMRSAEQAPFVSMYCAILRRLERELYQRAEDLVVLSSYTEEEVLGNLKITRPVTVIPGGVDLERFYSVSKQEKAAIRNRLGIPAGRPCLLTIRRLERRMGLFLLLDALGALRSSGVDFFAVIGGIGTLAGELAEYRDQRSLKDRVRLEGRIQPTDLPDYYRAADLFVLPTEALEGFGLIIPEAMACGCPVVGTPVGNIPNLLRPISADLVSKDVSAAGLAATIFHVLQTQNGDLGVKVAQYAKERFGWHEVVDQFEQHWSEYGSALKKPGPIATSILET